MFTFGEGAENDHSAGEIDIGHQHKNNIVTLKGLH